MKISELRRGVNQPPQAAVHADVSSKPASQSAFRDVLHGVDRSNRAEYLSRMSEDIVRQGEVLAARYDIAELKRYKGMLTEFLTEAIRYSYEFNKRSSRDGHGRHHVYVIVKRINEKLEKMTQDILNGQADQIQLMADINDINGMLVDLWA